MHESEDMCEMVQIIDIGDNDGDERVYRDASMYEPSIEVDVEQQLIEIPTVETGTDDTPNEANEQNQPMNVNALSMDASTYELENFKDKLLLIFNHKKFVSYPPRKGTEKDVAALRNTFGELGFTVKDYNDLTEQQIAETLKEHTSGDLSKWGCIAVAVLTHGTYKGMLMTERTSYSEQMIIDRLIVRSNQTLVTKPRIVIIQACRGEDDISAAHVGHGGPVYQDGVKKEKESYTLPMESDILVLHSTYAGNPAHRTNEGSWFIKALCTEIDNLAAIEDLESILTVVKRKVAIHNIHEKYDPKTMRMEYNKQMPVSTSTFTRKLYLRNFRGSGPSIVTETDEGEVGEVEVSSQSSVEVADLPATPHPAGDDGCICHLNRFMPMTECLKKYVADKPEDTKAVEYLEIVEPLLDDPDNSKMKRRLVKVISRHLSTETGSPYLQYLYDPETP